MQKIYDIVDSFQRSRDIDVQRVLQSDWWRAFRAITKEEQHFFPDMWLLKNHKEHCYAPFLRGKKTPTD